MISISLLCCCEKVFWIYGWLGKIWWDITTWKRRIYSHLNMEDDNDADNTHATRVFKDFKINNFSDYHDLCVLSQTLLLADVFENFKNMCLEKYELDPAYCFTLPGLAWQAALEKTKVKLDLLTDIYIIWMVGKGIRRGMCHVVYRYAKANKKYMEDHDQNKKSSYLKYWDVNDLCGWYCPIY